MTEVLKMVGIKDSMANAIVDVIASGETEGPEKLLKYCIAYARYRLERCTVLLVAVGERSGWETHNEGVLVRSVREEREALDLALQDVTEGKTDSLRAAITAKGELLRRSDDERDRLRGSGLIRAASLIQ